MNITVESSLPWIRIAERHDRELRQRPKGSAGLNFKQRHRDSRHKGPAQNKKCEALRSHRSGGFCLTQP